MDIFSIGIGWLIAILLTINLGAAIFIKGEDRFWLPSVGLWIFIFLMTLLIKINNWNTVETKKLIYSQTIEKDGKGDEKKETEMEDAKKQSSIENNKTFTLLAVQTIASFFWQAVGYQATGKKYFKKGIISFFILMFIFLIIEIFILLS